MQIVLGDEKVDLQLTERIQQVRRKLTEKEKTDRVHLSTSERWTQEKVPTGELVLTFKNPDRYHMMKEWRETLDSPLEKRLDEAVAGLAGIFEELRLICVHEAEARARQEERCRAEMDRKREAIRSRRLLNQSQNWQTAADLNEQSAKGMSRNTTASPLASDMCPGAGSGQPYRAAANASCRMAHSAGTA
ncbi:hypothetical protein [Hyphomicrobium sp. CS1GBMeth3]|uniref:hypothetical protein n=1 Tax=Hyphomicrobium sp. CS1GBMeth3 TaxID=1892845 RepID=UPI0009317679|nr:hypothetical protein [Hyphomicrobium sp. CS1GBMeth3]